MAATRKIDLINGALTELRISGLTVGPTSFDLEQSQNVLEDMAAELYATNVIPSWNFQDTPSVTDLTYVAPEYNNFFKTNLAVRLLNVYGKEVPQALMAKAAAALSKASGMTAVAIFQQVQYPQRMPLGSGTQRRFYPWLQFQRQPAPPPESTTTHVMLVGDVNTYTEAFDSYLQQGETITAIKTAVADPGLMLNSYTLASPLINYTITAENLNQTGQYQQVKFVVQTSNGRITTRKINFNILPNQTVGGN